MLREEVRNRQHQKIVRRAVTKKVAITLYLWRARTMAAACTGIRRAPRAEPDAGSKTGGTVKRVNAGVLDVAYLESGPAAGSPVVLLHGFPYDVHSYDLGRA